MRHRSADGIDDDQKFDRAVGNIRIDTGIAAGTGSVRICFLRRQGSHGRHLRVTAGIESELMDWAAGYPRGGARNKP